MIRIPLIDLKAQHEPIRGQLATAMCKVMASCEFSGGEMVERFEEEFAGYCGVRHAVAAGSGTDALWLALLALGVGPGDEVVTVPMTFIATAEAISRTGARPVFVDIDALTYTMDPLALARALTPRTKAIVPVHLFGQTADMDAILAIADERGIPVVEDAAQAHGALNRGRRAGSMGVAGCFSFYPSKNLGALGEAGAVVTDDAAMAAAMRMLRDHGQCRKYEHVLVGWNCRMDALQAAVLRVKLPGLDAANERRRQHAERYLEAWRQVDGVTAPHSNPKLGHVHHLHVVRVARREQFVRRLSLLGIGWGIHYPVPVHLQPAYAAACPGPGAFPVSESCARGFVSLPMHPELTGAQVEAVIAAVCEAAGPLRRRKPPLVSSSSPTHVSA